MKSIIASIQKMDYDLNPDFTSNGNCPLAKAIKRKFNLTSKEISVRTDKVYINGLRYNLKPRFGYDNFEKLQKAFKNGRKLGHRIVLEPA